MSGYGIDIFNFEQWAGPPPPIPTMKVTESHRPGATGVAHQLLGTWGDTFEVTLTAVYANQLFAMEAYRLMKSIIGTGMVPLKYNYFNWTGMYGVAYHVMAVDQVQLRSVPRLIGPNYDLIGGCVLVTKWTLSPQQV
jgi:hypothetical protein